GFRTSAGDPPLPRPAQVGAGGTARRDPLRAVPRGRPQPALVDREVGGLLAGGPGLAVGGRAPAPAQGEEGRPAGRQARRQVLTALSASASCCYPIFAAPLTAAALTHRGCAPRFLLLSRSP